MIRYHSFYLELNSWHWIFKLLAKRLKWTKVGFYEMVDVVMQKNQIVFWQKVCEIEKHNFFWEIETIYSYLYLLLHFISNETDNQFEKWNP